MLRSITDPLLITMAAQQFFSNISHLSPSPKQAIVYRGKQQEREFEHAWNQLNLNGTNDWLISVIHGIKSNSIMPYVRNNTFSTKMYECILTLSLRTLTT